MRFVSRTLWGLVYCHARCTARVRGADFRFGIDDLVCSRAPSELAAQKQTGRLGKDLVNER